jgi:hypothetical protein
MVLSREFHVSNDLLPSLIPYFGCVIERVADGVQLRGAGRPHMNAAALTPQSFRPPFTLKTTAKTDSTNLRLYWHVGEVILNWECDVRQLRIHHPDTGRQVGLEGLGFIATNEWHEVVWEVKPTTMRVVIDGQVRFEGAGAWSDISAPLAIGPCFGSIVTVRAFAVET